MKLRNFIKKLFISGQDSINALSCLPLTAVQIPYLRQFKIVLTAMISRRNIRVKVMQTLYTLDSLENLSKPGEPQKILQQHFNQTRSLLVYLSWFLTEVARYAEIESHKRASKHLPSSDDLNVNTKIAGNEVLWKMLEDAALKEQFEK